VDWGDEAGDVMLYMLSPGVGDGVVNLRQWPPPPVLEVEVS
jgi:hypothetical protein